MLKLKTLKFSGIGRFVDEQIIEFQYLDNLVQIDGINNNTSGSSGSGKSTIFEALDWLLGISDISTTILQSRLTNTHMSVTGQFDWDGKSVIIKRAKKLSIDINGVEISGSSKLTEEKLDEILGLPRNLFRPLIHKRQGETGFFLQMTPSKMNDFLTDVLGLGSIRSKIDRIDLKLKELGPTTLRAQNDLESLQAALNATKEAIESIGEKPITDITQEILDQQRSLEGLKLCVLDALEKTHAVEVSFLDQEKPELITEQFDRADLIALEAELLAINTQIATLLDTERQRQDKINKQISALKLENFSQISNLNTEFNREIYVIKNEISNNNLVVNEGIEAKEQALKIANKIKVIREGSCHTCEQAWVTQKAKAEEQKLLEEIHKAKSKIELANKASITIITLESKLKEFTNSHNNKLNEIDSEFKIQTSSLLEQTKPQGNEEILILKEQIKTINDKKKEELIKEGKHNTVKDSKNHILMEDYLKKKKLVANRHEEEMSQSRIEFESAQRVFFLSFNSYKSHKEAVMRYESTFESLKTKENDLNSKIVHMNQNVVHLKEQLDIIEEAKRCLKSYLSCSFDDALDAISDTSTRILRAIPTMANATIRLEGTKETNAGAVKEQIVAMLDNDGEIDVPIKSLSGGERSAVDLAIDLAVGVLIQEKANKGLDLLVLDEPFNGFDSVGISNALEMLKTFATDKKILIVEHDSVAKEFITNKITVIRTDEISKIA